MKGIVLGSLSAHDQIAITGRRLFYGHDPAPDRAVQWALGLAWGGLSNRPRRRRPHACNQLDSHSQDAVIDTVSTTLAGSTASATLASSALIKAGESASRCSISTRTRSRPVRKGSGR